jgi:hypothetical protein
MKKISLNFLLFSCIALLLSGCQKTTTTPTTPTTPTIPTIPDYTYSTDNLIADFAFSDIYNTMSGEDDAGNQLRACATLTLVTTPGTTYPITVTAVFNGSGCGDGRVRTGTLTAVYSGRWYATGTVVTITSDAANPYTVSGYVLEGVNTVTNTSGTTGNPSFTSVITSGGKVTTPAGAVILRAGTRNYEMTSGTSTPLDITDDVWQLDGSITGTTSSGKEYTATIAAATPVVKAQSCKWVESGIVVITPSDGTAATTVDYSEGTGACDATAKVTYSIWSVNVTMQ